MPAPTVFYDANVLYPAELRNLLMHIAVVGIFNARWSAEIHEEWIGSLLANRPDLTRARLERTRRLMDENAPDALVTNYEFLIPTLNLPDPDDRHVLAAAIRCGASVIVTQNLKDFPAYALQPFNLEAQHPDDFILELLYRVPGRVLKAAESHRGSLKNPPRTWKQYVDSLAGQGLPKSASALFFYINSSAEEPS